KSLFSPTSSKCICDALLTADSPVLCMSVRSLLLFATSEANDSDMARTGDIPKRRRNQGVESGILPLQERRRPARPTPIYASNAGTKSCRARSIPGCQSDCPNSVAYSRFQGEGYVHEKND